MPHNRRRFLAAAAVGAAPLAAAPASKPSNALRARLVDAFARIECVDSHEHTTPEDERTSAPFDFFTLASQYLRDDLVSAGLTVERAKASLNTSLSDAERWRAIEPFWKNARLTGYGQALRIAVRDIYGFDEISAATVPKISDAIRRRNKPGLYREVLRDRAKIQYAVVDDYWNAAPVELDPRFFALARKFDRFMTPARAEDVRALEKLTGVSVTSLAGLKAAMEKSFDQSLKCGMVTVKTTIAYNRQLHFAEVEASAAERDLTAVLRDERAIPRGFRYYVDRPHRNLEDHMFHHAIRLAEAHNLPVQIHTGILAGNGNYITNTNPTHLTNIFFLYPKVAFDLFHIGYPYQAEAGVLAKMFPNVHVDFCWAHILSPSAARHTLREYLDSVPMNKIMGYGGDYRYVELSYAHLVMARRNIAEVLSDLVEARECSETDAVEVGQMLLRDNPARLFPRRRA